MDDTLLELSAMGIPLYSGRGLTETLTPIEESKDLARDINGDLIDLSVAQFQKYQSKITCRDVQAPAIDGIWPGQPVTVSCVPELSFPNGGTPSRAIVDGSLRVAGDFTFYRPRLQMRVVEVTTSMDEWAADIQWELDLEEI